MISPCVLFAGAPEDPPSAGGLLGPDKTSFLDAKRRDIRVSIDARQSFQEWQGLNALLRFGGRPARSPLVETPSFDDDGVALPTTEKVADHMRLDFASVEHARLLTSKDVAERYNGTPLIPKSDGV